MSVRDSSKLIASYFVDFSVSNLPATYGSAITFMQGGTNLAANCKGIYIENTSGTPVEIGTGLSSAPSLLDVSPINNNVEKSLIVSATQQIFLKSAGSAITTGKFLICFYN